MAQARFNMVLPQWLKDEALAEANKKGVSLAEYIKDLMKRELINKKTGGIGTKIGDKVANMINNELQNKDENNEH